MLFQLRGNLVHVDLRLVVLRLEGGHGIGGLLKQTQEALLLLLREVQVLELHHQIGEHIPHLSQVLRPDAAQGRAGEVGNIGLGRGAVGQHLV